jgi:hypothetical protein
MSLIHNNDVISVRKDATIKRICKYDTFCVASDVIDASLKQSFDVGNCVETLRLSAPEAVEGRDGVSGPGDDFSVLVDIFLIVQVWRPVFG